MRPTVETPSVAPTAKNPWLVLMVMCLGFFMILLDLTIVNVAIPSIIDGLHSTLDQILWVLNSYILIYAVLLITAGRLGDLYGPRNLFIAGLVVFTLGSAWCGLAQDTNQLILARVAQGAGGALLTPQTLAIINSIFPPQRRGAAFGIWGAVAGVASLAGPTLGGLITTDYGWRWIFYVNVPIGIVAVVAALLIVPDIRPGKRHGIDLIGVLLSSAGLFGIVFGLIEGQRYDWGTVWNGITIPEIIGAGVVLTGLFFILERFAEEPLVPLSLFRERNFALMNWVTAAVSFAMLGLFLPFMIYLQSVRGMSALNAGLTVAPMSLTSMVVAPWAGRFSDKIGGKYILMTGLTLFGLGMAYVAWVAGPSSTWTDFLPGLILAGVGVGCTFAPLVTVAMRRIEPQMAGAASGVFNTTRQVGGAVGSAVVGAVLQNRLATSLHDHAVAAAAQLPPAFRGRFIDAFAQAAKGGFEVGRGQSGGSFQLPPGVPPQVAQHIAQLGHDVFTAGYLDAYRPTLAVPVASLLVAALSCVFIVRGARGRTAERVQPAEEERRLAAAGGS